MSAPSPTSDELRQLIAEARAFQVRTIPTTPGTNESIGFERHDLVKRNDISKMVEVRLRGEITPTDEAVQRIRIAEELLRSVSTGAFSGVALDDVCGLLVDMLVTAGAMMERRAYNVEAWPDDLKVSEINALKSDGAKRPRLTGEITRQRARELLKQFPGLTQTACSTLMAEKYGGEARSIARTIKSLFPS